MTKLMPLLLLAIIGYCGAEKMIGSLKTLAHAVKGDLYFVDESTLMLKNFNYDGTGPDAYFYMGKSSAVKPGGVILPYPQQFKEEKIKKKIPILKKYTNQDVEIKLPSGIKVSDFKWFSVWCDAYSVDFGSLSFDGSTLEADDSGVTVPMTSSVLVLLALFSSIFTLT